MLYNSDFIRLLENINFIRDRLLWLPLSSDDTEEAIFDDLFSYIKEYENNKRNSA